jgi:hypothetical protein
MPSLLGYLKECKGEGCSVVPLVRDVTNRLVAAVPQPQQQFLGGKSLTQLVAAYQPPSLGKIASALHQKRN